MARSTLPLVETTTTPAGSLTGAPGAAVCEGSLGGTGFGRKPPCTDRGARTRRRNRVGWVPFDAQVNALHCQALPAGESGSIRALEAEDGLNSGSNPAAEEVILSGCAGRLGWCGPGLGRLIDAGRVPGSNGTPLEALTLRSRAGCVGKVGRFSTISSPDMIPTLQTKFFFNMVPTRQIEIFATTMWV